MTRAIGSPFGPPGLRLIDADSHINEPPDLWASRVPTQFRERAPRMQRFEQGDAWVLDGVTDPINFGLNAAAGVPAADRKPWVFWEDIRAGGYQPKARLDEMDTDFVDASVLYPTPRILQYLAATQEPEFHLALIQAYNDWLIEFAGEAPDRLGALFVIPNRGVDMALAEIERVAEKTGVVGGLIGCYPHGDLDLSDADDAVWRKLVEAELALHIHVRLANTMPADAYAAGVITESRARGDLRFLEAPGRMNQFLTAGVFDRIPSLQVVFAEVDAGWVPYVKEQLDNRLMRRTPGKKMRELKLPSQVIDEHFYYTYITDSFAVHNRHAVGLERMMWSSDFPHSGSDWPRSSNLIQAAFWNVPADERDLILAGNAQRLYRFSS